jgi:hypothetical protein
MEMALALDDAPFVVRQPCWTDRKAKTFPVTLDVLFTC